MKINWKVRFKNGTFLVTFGTLVITFVYTVLGLFKVVPPVSENVVVNVVLALIQLLAGLGIVSDPTTKGVCDSAQALCYEQPAENANSTAASNDTKA